jgi:hypothetical protein
VINVEKYFPEAPMEVHNKEGNHVTSGVEKDPENAGNCGALEG